MDDTIVAIATPLGVGAISIIRVSGKDAIKIVNKIFKGKNLEKVPTHTVHYGHIIEMTNIIDEVLVSVFKAPKTFTKEDVVEINSHGSIASTNKILELLLENGCRMAEPGEFTKRAYLNGRIDLLEAEGIMDIINAKSEEARKLAMNQIDGKLSNLIRSLRQDIIEILANIEVNIDYPEYEDILDLTVADLQPKMKNIEIKIKELLNNSENGKLIKNGIKIAIIGKPNVGKSSLLNAFLGEEKAIVTDIQGTTRDYVEGSIYLNGIPLNFIDTAGIRKTDDIVEKIGVDKSMKMIEEADLILFLLNNNETISKEEYQLLENIKNKKYIIIVNKNDLETKINIDEKLNPIFMSTLNPSDIDKILDRIKELFKLEQLKTSDFTYISNARSIAILKETLKRVEDVNVGIKNEMPIDMVEIDLKEIWNLLGTIIGESYEDELINQLFSQFCLGK